MNTYTEPEFLAVAETLGYRRVNQSSRMGGTALAAADGGVVFVRDWEKCATPDDVERLLACYHSLERKNRAAAALGRMGGASTSPAKRAASARNGAAGGRPRRVFRFPEFAPGFDRAYELRVGDEVVPISTRRPDEEPTWSLSRDQTILAHGVSLPGGRRHRGASVSASGVATVAHGLHRVAAIEWTSRPLPRSMPADRREALGGRERVLVVRVEPA